jgi:hypothetical protein
MSKAKFETAFVASREEYLHTLVTQAVAHFKAALDDADFDIEPTKKWAVRLSWGHGKRGPQIRKKASKAHRLHRFMLQPDVLDDGTVDININPAMTVTSQVKMAAVHAAISILSNEYSQPPAMRGTWVKYARFLGLDQREPDKNNEYENPWVDVVEHQTVKEFVDADDFITPDWHALHAGLDDKARPRQPTRQLKIHCHKCTYLGRHSKRVLLQWRNLSDHKCTPEEGEQPLADELDLGFTGEPFFTDESDEDESPEDVPDETPEDEPDETPEPEEEPEPEPTPEPEEEPEPEGDEGGDDGDGDEPEDEPTPEDEGDDDGPDFDDDPYEGDDDDDGEPEDEGYGDTPGEGEETPEGDDDLPWEDDDDDGSSGEFDVPVPEDEGDEEEGPEGGSTPPEDAPPMPWDWLKDKESHDPDTCTLGRLCPVCNRD